MVRNVGVGSLPGTDIVEALKVVIDEHTGFMYLPELPNRGPGADMIGRTGDRNHAIRIEVRRRTGHACGACPVVFERRP